MIRAKHGAEKRFVRRGRLQPRRKCHARAAALEAAEVRGRNLGIEKTYPRAKALISDSSVRHG